MNRTRTALAILAALAVAGVAQAQPTAPKAAAPAASSAAPAAAPAGKTLYPQSQFDFMLKERLAQGAPDTPELRNAILKVNDSSVEAIVQVGTNLAMARLAGIAEFWLDKPVIAINTATYWHALRTNGIADRVYGFGSLLVEH